jgi:GNAT superfamily N-acetyltransferase
LGDTERLEQYWHSLVLTILQAKDLKGAVITCHPDILLPPFNHAADINVNEAEIENLLNTGVKHFQSRGSAFVRFRITPLTRPRTFSSFLESHGFEKEAEDSIMVFKGKGLEDKLIPGGEVREISESEIDVADKLLFTTFEFPIEWKKKWDRLTLDWMQKGGKYYVAYVKGKPIGTSFLFSLMKTGGIFNVGTLKEYRKRGVGTALTVHAIMESIKEGNNIHTLQTAKGGNAERLYNEIGFVTDHTVTWYIKKL